MGRPRKNILENAETEPYLSPETQQEVVNYNNDNNNGENTESDTSPASSDEVSKEPKLWESEFESFALSLLSKDHKEIDESGRPLVKGLRRLVRLKVGPILESYPVIKQCPSPENEEHATTEYYLKVLNLYQLMPGEPPHEIRYGAASDAGQNNINGNIFKLFPVANSDTRSEGRALRKLLNISVATAEEMGPDINVEPVSSGQRNKVNVLANRLNINVLKLLAKGKYKKIDDMNFESGQKLLQLLSEYQRGAKQIPNDVVGYEEGWDR